MLAVSRADVDALNGMRAPRRRARGDARRRRRRGRGASASPSATRWCARRNARRLGVSTAPGAPSSAWDGHHIEVDDGPGVVTLPRQYIEAGHLDHGYATTVHKAQGRPMTRAFVLATEALGREAGYVAMSRARRGSRAVRRRRLLRGRPRPRTSSDEPLALVATRLATHGPSSWLTSTSGTRASPSAERANVPELGFDGATSGEASARCARCHRLWVTDFADPRRRPTWSPRSGTRPAFVDEQPRYDELAAAISEYRVRYDVEGDEPLGARPLRTRPPPLLRRLGGARSEAMTATEGASSTCPYRDVGLER